MTTDRRIVTHRKLAVAAGLLLAAAALGLVLLNVLAEDEPSTIDLQNSDTIALGRDVYKAQCAACHGVNLEGQPSWRERKENGRLPAPPHDETGHTWHHDDTTLFNLTKYGLAALIGQPVETDMPAYNGVLTDEEIRAVLAYIKSQWPEPIRERQAEINARAARKAGS